MKHWDMEQIKWDQFDPSLVDPKVVPLIKAASVVERNSVEYTVYLNNVFGHDAELKQVFQDWENEEVQHGEVLGRWAMMADPGWDYRKSFDRFQAFYKVDMQTDNSIRGSHAGEFIARAMVEVGTSSYYSALADYVQEPVLKEICCKIAGDEFRHYKLFYDCMKRYLQEDHLSKWTRAKIAFGRIVESQDDELASAYHITNEPEGMPYNHKRCIALYMDKAMPLYQRHHVARVVNMAFKTVGWMPAAKLQEFLAKAMMFIIKLQHKSYSKRIAGLG